MHFNYYFLRQLTPALSSQIVGKTLTGCFSQNKNELVFIFSSKGQDFNIKAVLTNEISIVFFPESIERAKKNSVDLFKEIQSLKVLSLRQFENERAFSILFENDFELVFKLQGKRANLLLFEREQLLKLFKNNLVNDHQVTLNGLNRLIDQSDTAVLQSNIDLKSIFPTFDKHCKKFLDDKQFSTSETEQKLASLKDLLNQLNAAAFYIANDESSGLPFLSLFDSHMEILNIHTDPIAATNDLASQLLGKFYFLKIRNQKKGMLEQQIRKSRSYILSNSQRLSELESAVKYEELANILMANLHVQTNPSAREIELFDFYRNENRSIKIKTSLSLQKNAELYYRKSKNQHIEVNNLKNNLASKQKELIQKENLLKKLLETKTIKEVKSLFPKTNDSKNSTKESPFMVVQIDGFEVFVGKNAKNNDLLTQKFAKKDDLWLHARDVSGSHVVIRKTSKQSVPLHTIEKVAQLAAWYSKRRNDSLCPVIYTEKKFVRKPKGSPPGQVTLSREEVILVKPSQSVQ